MFGLRTIVNLRKYNIITTMTLYLAGCIYIVQTCAVVMFRFSFLQTSAEFSRWPVHFATPKISALIIMPREWMFSEFSGCISDIYNSCRCRRSYYYKCEFLREYAIILYYITK